MLIFMRDGYQVVAWYQQEMAFAPMPQNIGICTNLVCVGGIFWQILVLFLMLNGVNENNHCCFKKQKLSHTPFIKDENRFCLLKYHHDCLEGRIFVVTSFDSKQSS